MAAKYGNIRNLVTVSAAVLLAFSAVAETETLAEADSGSSQQSSSAQKRLTPYEILRRARLQRAAEKTAENFSTGPVVATARLNNVPITRDSGAADKAAIQRVRVPPCQLPDSGT